MIETEVTDRKKLLTRMSNRQPSRTKFLVGGVKGLLLVEDTPTQTAKGTERDKEKGVERSSKRRGE